MILLRILSLTTGRSFDATSNAKNQDNIILDGASVVEQVESDATLDSRTSRYRILV